MKLEHTTRKYVQFYWDIVSSGFERDYIMASCPVEIWNSKTTIYEDSLRHLPPGASIDDPLHQRIATNEEVFEDLRLLSSGGAMKFIRQLEFQDFKKRCRELWHAIQVVWWWWSCYLF